MLTRFLAFKKSQFFTLLSLILLLSACSDKNQVYIDRIKEQVKENAAGVELNYKNLEFKWVDTLTVDKRKEQILTIKETYLKDISSIQASVNDFGFGKLFSLEYLTKDRLAELREWERKIRKRSQPKQDYYEFAKENKDNSEWFQTLLNQLDQTDMLLANHEKLREGNLDLIKNALGYYKRIDQYYNDETNFDLWNQVELRLETIQEIENELKTLETSNSSNIIHIKAYNKYSIINPLLNNAKVEIEKYYLFNETGEIIKSEEVE